MAETDQDLLAAARGGDRGAVEKLLERHQPAVYRFGLKMCREAEDAKDILQETLIAAARTLPEFRGASSLSTWLYTIARSFCIKRRRVSRFRPERLESIDDQAAGAGAVPDPRRSPEEEAAGRQLREVLDDAIAGLDPMYREVLVLRDVEGLPAAEVAEVMGLSVEAVKSRLHRARAAVREMVAPALTPAAPALAPGPGCADVVTVLSRKLEGEIDGATCAELEAHLAGCASCRGRCEALQATLSLCRRAGSATVPPEVARAVRDGLRHFLLSRPS